MVVLNTIDAHEEIAWIVHDEFTISQICEKKEVNMYYMENYLTLHRKLDKYLMTLGMISWKQLVMVY